MARTMWSFKWYFKRKYLRFNRNVLQQLIFPSEIRQFFSHYWLITPKRMRPTMKHRQQHHVHYKRLAPLLLLLTPIPTVVLYVISSCKCHRLFDNIEKCTLWKAWLFSVATPSDGSTWRRSVSVREGSVVVLWTSTALPSVCQYWNLKFCLKVSGWAKIQATVGMGYGGCEKD
jgi:hypothetical protein